MNGRLIIGLDIGGTKTAVVLGTPRGQITWRKQFATEPVRGFRAVFEELENTVRSAAEAAGGNAQAVSVSIGGPLDIARGIIKSPPNLPGWDNIPLKQLLKERFSLPTYVEHDGNAGALAEYYFGAGRGCRNIVFLTMGTGFGAGLILDGKIYRGTSDVAGEIGHVRIAEDGPLCYGKRGSLEGYASGTGISALAGMMFPQKWGYVASVQDIYTAYASGSPEARAVFDRAAVYLGRGLALIADILNPQRIILGGLGVRLPDALVEPARKVFEAESLPEARGVCEIVPAQLGDTIGDLAALAAALDQGNLLEYGT
jgi:glucokinase